MRCEGPSLADSSTFSTASVRTGAASVTVPSTVRNSPSDKRPERARALDVAPSPRTTRQQKPQHRQRQPHNALRAKAAMQHNTAMGGNAISTSSAAARPACMSAIPAANSHAAWKSGTALRPATAGLSSGAGGCRFRLHCAAKYDMVL